MYYIEISVYCLLLRAVGYKVASSQGRHKKEFIVSIHRKTLCSNWICYFETLPRLLT